jgi:D-3-phosphoglycerate dehydrogenase
MKVLIIDKMHESIHVMLKDIGVEPDYRPNISRSEVLQIISQYQGLVVRSKTPVDKELLSLAKELKFVARAGAGIDNVDMEEMDQKKITLLNAPEGNRDALGEHCVGLLLSLLNKIHTADREIRAGTWDREGNRGVELSGKTIGLLGFGYMGEAFAQKLQGFGVEILAYDIEKKGFSSQYVKEVSLEELKEKSQILSIHIPLNAHNKNLINEQFLNEFKKLRYLINSSRGEVLVLKDLVALLTKGTLKGAALDVLENERITRLTVADQRVFDQLIKLPQVVLTPHVAGWTFESYYKINEILTAKIKKLMQKISYF